MAKHEFGIMQSAPEQGECYVKYEPQKYNCIAVNDDCLEDIIANFNHIACYWHTLDVKKQGIAYCGITLIPPDSLGALIDVMKDISDLFELQALMKKALAEHKWIIHFGI